MEEGALADRLRMRVSKNSKIRYLPCCIAPKNPEKATPLEKSGYMPCCRRNEKEFFVINDEQIAYCEGHPDGNPEEVGDRGSRPCDNYVPLISQGPLKRYDSSRDFTEGRIGKDNTHLSSWKEQVAIRPQK